MKAIDAVNRADVIDMLEMYPFTEYGEYETAREVVKRLPSAEPEIAENLYLCKCYITDKDGLQHEVIHTGDIRRVTGWEI